METWDLLAHGAMLLFAISYWVKEIVWLRLISILASVSEIIYFYFAPPSPVWVYIFWNAVFITANVIHLSLLARERTAIHLNEDEQDLHDTLFREFSLFEFMRLMRIGRWVDVPAGRLLTRQGDTVQDVTLIVHGRASVRIHEEVVAQLKDGSFVGEMSFISGQPATASVVTDVDTRCLMWCQRDLKHLLARNPNMRFTMQSLFSRDLLEKLTHTQQETTASPPSADRP